MNWEHYYQLLLTATEAATMTYFASSQDYDLSAIGYTFELANASPAFSLVMNSKSFFDQTVEKYKKLYPQVTYESLRWSSGDFDCCALSMSQQDPRALQWEREYVTLHTLSCQDSRSFNDVYVGLVNISCEALATLASRGLFGDWRKLVFNVAEYCDETETIKARHQHIVSLAETQTAS